MLKKIFPHSYRVFPRNGLSLFVNIIIWIVICFGLMDIARMIGLIPFIGDPIRALIQILGTFYCLASIILTVLVCLGIVKN